MQPTSLFPGLPGKSKPRTRSRRWIPRFVICAWPECGKEFRTQPSGHSPTGHTIFCSKSCAQSYRNTQRYGDRDPEQAKTRALAKARKRRMMLDAAGWDGVTDHAIYERDRWHCWICRKRIDPAIRYPHPDSPSVDHITPLSRGGDDTQYNKRAAHLACNHARGDGQTGDQPTLAYQPTFQRQRMRYIPCPVCGQGIGATTTCKRHKQLHWCQRCNHLIPRGISRRLCPPCKQAEIADEAERKRTERANRKPKLCAAEGCDRAGSFGRGYCAPHYLRWKKHGDVFAHIPIADNRLTRLEVGELILAELNRT